jgi:hypothetical protein
LPAKDRDWRQRDHRRWRLIDARKITRHHDRELCLSAGSRWLQERDIGIGDHVNIGSVNRG